MAESFDSEPFNYLLKDDSIERKTDVIKRSIDKVLGLNKCFTIKQKSSIYTFKISDIFFVECLQKHIIYHFKNKKIEVRGKISTVYEELKPYGFLKVHQGYIVNMNQISKFDSQSVVLVSGDVVPVSIREKSNAVSEYIRFVEKRVV
jgi:DNA-binding LytR/AlgR family response regulator